MCYARRQRSSWARIKLSEKLYINRVSPDNISFRAVFGSLLIIRVQINSKEFFGVSYFFSEVQLSLLFNFQGALLACPVSRDSLYIIPCRFRFVKRFFKVFSNFFQPLVRFLRAARGDLYIIPHRVQLCQEVFETFFKFFSWSLRIRASLPESLYIILHLLPFVNTFF